MKLSIASLAALPKDVAGPAYDRSRLKPGIVHIGVGNFHRAHMARYMDDLFARGLDRDWAILGAGVRPGDAAMRDKLEAQDWLTTAVELGPDAIRARVVGSMVGFVPVEADNQTLIRAMSDPAIRIVSLTVTEGGYYIDPATQRFDAGHPDIQHDVRNPHRPRTAFGAMVAALEARRARDRRRSQVCHATTFRATAPFCAQRWWSLRASPTPISLDGSTVTEHFPTPWSTALCPPPDPESWH